MKIQVSAEVDLEDIVDNLDREEAEGLVFMIEKYHEDCDFLESLTFRLMGELKKEKVHIKNFSFDKWFKERE